MSTISHHENPIEETSRQEILLIIGMTMPLLKISDDGSPFKNIYVGIEDPFKKGLPKVMDRSIHS